MKKYVSLTLCIVLASTLWGTLAVTAEEPELGQRREGSETTNTALESSQQIEAVVIEESFVIKNGMLGMLNATEEEMVNFLEAHKLSEQQLDLEGFIDFNLPLELQKAEYYDAREEVTYFDTLDSMLMALNAGDIHVMIINETTADYLGTPGLVKLVDRNDSQKRNAFTKVLDEELASFDYSFMMMEDQASLRDEFDTAILTMKIDGTLYNLIDEYITQAVNEKGEIPAVEIPVFEGAETIKVAVTGCLPPLDYVAEDKTPAGFSTALLAEIGNRLHKNIEIVVVKSGDRASALSGGVADAALWTRANIASYDRMKAQTPARPAEGLTEEEEDVLDQMNELFPYSTFATMDMPQGTIITGPYYSDRIIDVVSQSFADEILDWTKNHPFK